MYQFISYIIYTDKIALTNELKFDGKFKFICEGNLVGCILYNGNDTHWRRNWYIQIIQTHYNDVIMGAIASQITSLTIVFSTFYLDADQRKHQSSASLAFVWEIHQWPVNSPHKGPVTRKMFPFMTSSCTWLKLANHFLIWFMHRVYFEELFLTFLGPH